MTQRISRGILYEAGRFSVELRKCRCHFGCEECLRTQVTDSFDAAERYWACFEHADDARTVCGADFNQAVLEGQKILGKMKQRYGADSPSLVKQLKMIPSKREVWLKLETPADLDPWIERAEEVQHLSYTGTFFKPSWISTGQEHPSVHIRCHQNNPENARLIMGYLSIVEEQGLPVHETQFFDKTRIPMEGDVPFLKKTLSALGWTIGSSARADEAHYETDSGCRFAKVLIEEQHLFVSVDVSSAAGFAFAKQLTKTNGIFAVSSPMQENIERLLTEPDGSG